VVVENVVVAFPPAGVFCPICCAPAASVHKRNMAVSRMFQNLARSVSCTLRIAFAGFASPN
jgi:hypothetical protein